MARKRLNFQFVKNVAHSGRKGPDKQIPPRHLIEGPLQSIRSTHCPDLQTQTLALLQAADDLEQVAYLRVAVRPQHPHQAPGRLAGHSAEFPKSDCRVDVVA